MTIFTTPVDNGYSNYSFCIKKNIYHQKIENCGQSEIRKDRSRRWFILFLVVCRAYQGESSNFNERRAFIFFKKRHVWTDNANGTVDASLGTQFQLPCENTNTYMSYKNTVFRFHNFHFALNPSKAQGAEPASLPASPFEFTSFLIRYVPALRLLRGVSACVLNSY